jgi:hypothetical protein
LKTTIAVKRPRVFIPAALDSNFEATVGVHMDSMSLRCQQLEYQPPLRLAGGDVEQLSITLNVLLTEEPIDGATPRGSDWSLPKTAYSIHFPASV